MFIVQKFGGSSVADKEKLMNAALRVAETYNGGNDVIVVVSAQGNTTDELIKAAGYINENASKREMDMLLSTGEQQSAALMAMALDSLGVPAISLNAWQLGIMTTDEYSNAKIEGIAVERIKKEISEHKVVIAAGFQGINGCGDITTLGRGGSDTTAVALAVALKADKCEIFTDVEGVFTADPRVVDCAEKLKSISYDEMLDYTTMGAKVLHNRSVGMAKNYGMPICVRSSFTKNKGTAVCDEKTNRIVSGIAANKNISLVKVRGISKIIDAEYIFKALADENICVDMIMSSGNKRNSIIFSVDSSDIEDVKSVIEKCHGDNYRVDEGFSKISIVGIGIETNPGVAALAFETFNEENIDVKIITTSEIKISILVEKKDEDKAVKALHKKFIE